MPAEETRHYFDALYQGKSDASKILVWGIKLTKPPEKRSLWAGTPEEAARAAESFGDQWHVYAGIGLSPKNFGSNRRATMDVVCALPCLWVDIDIGSVGHKGSKTAPDDVAALRLIDAMGAPASMVVSTGGGLHGYWFFKEPWDLTADQERVKAITLSRGWQAYAMDHAEAIGFAIDGTHDLARVLRVPGTFNWKHEPPRLCAIRSLVADRRYDPSDLDALITPGARSRAAGMGGGKAQRANRAQRDSTSNAPSSGTKTGRLVYSSTAEPPGLKFVALCDNEPKFKASFYRQRKDISDTSPSGYDMSMARYCVRAGFTDQEIVDTLIASRRHHRDDLKLNRPDYYETYTLGQARSESKREQATGNIRERAVTAPQGNERDAILLALSESLGPKIVRIIRYNQDPPQYRLITGKGEIHLGGVENLISQTALRNAIAASDGFYVPKFKATDWDGIAQSLLDACETVETGPESTDAGAMRAWLSVYLDENPPNILSNAAISNQVPCSVAGEVKTVYVFLAHFREWLIRRQGERISTKQLGVYMRRVDAESKVIAHTVTLDGNEERETTRNVWVVPYDRQISRPEKSSNGKHEMERQENKAR